MGPVAKYLEKDITQRQLLPYVSDLMKDEFHDVRFHIVAQAGLIAKVIGTEQFVLSLLPTIQSLIMDNHWRIRQSVVEQVPKLAELFDVDLFQTKLEALFLSSLKDSVQSVRNEAATHLEDIVKLFGEQWTVSHLMPKITEQYGQPSGYANRVTTLNALERIANGLSEAKIEECIVPILTKAMKDGVPNVRFCTCIVVTKLVQRGKISKDHSIKASLLDLENDSDTDVVYQARLALAQGFDS